MPAFKSSQDSSSTTLGVPITCLLNAFHSRNICKSRLSRGIHGIVVGFARSSTITLPLLLTGGAGLLVQGVEISRASQRALVVLIVFATTLQTVSVCVSL